MTQVLKQKQKKVSAKLNKILDNITGLFGKLNVQVELAFKVGKEEGFTENEIAHLVRQKMKTAGYTYETIATVLKANHPDVIQQGHKRNSGTKTSRKSGTSSVTNKGKVDYQLDPEEKDFDELLAWENDLPGFPPELLLRYTIQLIKVSRQEVQQLKEQLEDFTKKWTKTSAQKISSLEKENAALKSKEEVKK